MILALLSEATEFRRAIGSLSGIVDCGSGKLQTAWTAHGTVAYISAMSSVSLRANGSEPAPAWVPSRDAVPPEIERDVYRALLNLAFHDDVDALLAEALQVVTVATRARQGYLEIRDDAHPDASWWTAHGLEPDDVAGVRAVISRGIIGEALATGETILTPAAHLDPLFRERESVKRNGIEAVLCAPIGTNPPRGVLYLQGWSDPDRFGAADRELAETFCRYLAQLVDRLLVRRRQARETDATRRVRGRLDLTGVVGHGAALADTLEQIALVAPLDVSVLLTGDTGTGKSLFARIIHDNSARARQPFVEINCAALPAQLVESELFGALPGAHSTATRRIEGKVAAAARGTLLLDEIAELSPEVQAKLLSFVQSKRYYPLGATKPETADVRVIAATNTDLERAVAEGRFREDLFYRLQVLPVRVPSLAERREDVAELVSHFAHEACTRHGLPRVAPSPGALLAAETTAWPGNVRQLAHAVEAAAIRAVGEGAAQLEPRHLFPNAPRSAAADQPVTFHERTRRFQTEILREALDQHDWNVTEVARRLDLARTHVYNLIKAFGLSRA
jgi:Nif-specific regulatory protein